MSLTSPWFAVFAAAVLIAYYHVPGRVQWKVLLLASMAFYLWAGAAYLVIMLTTALCTWFAAVVMDRRLHSPGARRSAVKAQNRQLLTVCLVLTFGLLLFCKACLVKPVSAALSGSHISFLTLGLPLGISFYLFQSTGYVMDVYRGTAAAERNFFRYLLFVSWFPQLIQGPISRHGKLSPQLAAPHPYEEKTVALGCQRMLWGYFKKLVIADRLAPAVAVLRETQGNGGAFALLTLLYALRLYGDFTGGIDIALGFSEMLGIRLPENFCRPFFAKNTAEYWRRWHITLGEWMKDYIFYPISVSKPFLKLGRISRRRWGSFGKRVPVYAASGVTWFATGFWHGLTPNFILWGMLNWGIITLSQELAPVYRRFHGRFHLKDQPWYGWFEMVRMFLLMNLVRIIDLFPNVGDYFRGLWSLVLPWEPVRLPLTGLDWWILGLGTAVMLWVSLMQEKGICLRERLWQRPAARRAVNMALFLIILLAGRYGVGYDPASFIYNQF